MIVFAAGSLGGALNTIARSFMRDHNVDIRVHSGPSGLLRQQIEAGETCHLFASANTAHPAALHRAGLSGPVVPFASNAMCALARADLKAATSTLLDLMLAPGIKLGTSTPKADPCGDYAWDIFKRAEVLRPGSQQVLSEKAIKITGGPKEMHQNPEGESVYQWAVESGAADIVLTYLTNADPVAKRSRKAELVRLPDVLSLTADFALTVIDETRPEAVAFALSVLSSEARKVLDRYGFGRPTYTG